MDDIGNIKYLGSAWHTEKQAVSVCTGRLAHRQHQPTIFSISSAFLPPAIDCMVFTAFQNTAYDMILWVYLWCCFCCLQCLVSFLPLPKSLSQRPCPFSVFRTLQAAPFCSNPLCLPCASIASMDTSFTTLKGRLYYKSVSCTRMGPVETGHSHRPSFTERRS